MNILLFLHHQQISYPRVPDSTRIGVIWGFGNLMYVVKDNMIILILILAESTKSSLVVSVVDWTYMIQEIRVLQWAILWLCDIRYNLNTLAPLHRLRCSQLEPIQIST